MIWVDMANNALAVGLVLKQLELSQEFLAGWRSTPRSIQSFCLIVDRISTLARFEIPKEFSSCYQLQIFT